MPTVLRISGPYELLQQSILASRLEFVESIASRKRREIDGTQPHEASTFNCTVSDADGDQVPVQITEAAKFLSDNLDSILEVRSLPGAENQTLHVTASLDRSRKIRSGA